MRTAKRGPSDLNAGATEPAVCRSVWAMILSRAANIIIHCEGKVIVSGIGKSGHIGKNRRDACQYRYSAFVHRRKHCAGDLGSD